MSQVFWECIITPPSRHYDSKQNNIVLIAITNNSSNVLYEIIEHFDFSNSIQLCSARQWSRTVLVKLNLCWTKMLQADCMTWIWTTDLSSRCLLVDQDRPTLEWHNETSWTPPILCMRRGGGEPQHGFHPKGAPAWVNSLTSLSQIFWGIYLRKISAPRLFVSELVAHSGIWSSYRFAQIE